MFSVILLCKVRKRLLSSLNSQDQEEAKDQVVLSLSFFFFFCINDYLFWTCLFLRAWLSYYGSPQGKYRKGKGKDHTQGSQEHLGMTHLSEVFHGHPLSGLHEGTRHGQQFSTILKSPGALVRLSCA